MKKADRKIFLGAVALMWNRPLEDAALQIEFNDSGITGYAE